MLKSEVEKMAYEMQRAYLVFSSIGGAIKSVGKKFPEVGAPVLHAMWMAIDMFIYVNEIDTEGIAGEYNTYEDDKLKICGGFDKGYKVGYKEGAKRATIKAQKKEREKVINGAQKMSWKNTRKYLKKT